MAELSYPSPDHNARAVTEAEYEHINARATDDGIEGNPTDAPVVTAGIGLQVLVKANMFGVVRGFAWTSGTTDVPLTVSGNSSGQTRYDWVVLRLDRTTWNVRAALLEGTPGAGSPALTQEQGSGVWEITLALVTVPNGAASVSVTPWTQYVGARIRPANSNRIPSHSELGEHFFHPDTGDVRFWDGTAMRTTYSDTGVLTLGAGFDTWQNQGENVGRRRTDHVYLRIWKSRAGVTFDRNDASGSKVAVLPAQLVPSRYEHFPVHFSGSGGNATLQIRPDGEVWVIENDSDVTVGRHLAVTCNYLID